MITWHGKHNSSSASVTQGDKNVPKVLVVAQCEDSVKWEQGFRTHADLFRSMTINTSMTYGISEGNHIAVCGEPSDLAAYMKVLESPATAAAMAFDGVLRDTVKVFVLDKELEV
jgi:hypothetical protein